MHDTSDFLKLIKKTAMEAVEASKPSDIVYGVVESISPIKIYVDQKFILTQNFISIPKHLTDYETEISFDDPLVKQVYTTWNMAETEESSPSKISFKQKTKHKITVYNGLKEGDKVILLRQQGGQKYLVIDKVVM